MTEIKLIRSIFTDKSTIGKIYINSNLICYTLEDKDRNLKQTDSLEIIKQYKVFGVTCIPYGRYKVILSTSNRFKMVLPELVNVPGYEGVRIHTGNKPGDTEGCILPGSVILPDSVGSSKIAFDKLFDLIKDSKEVEIEIVKA